LTQERFGGGVGVEVAAAQQALPALGLRGVELDRLQGLLGFVAGGGVGVAQEL
jgi:hypothetical protein